MRLAGTPDAPPQFSVEVKLSSGQKLAVADPRATRAMVALMDMNAVLGGAASHWGGPSAFAELMSAIHGIMFAESRATHQPWFERFSFVNDGGHCENGLYALKANYGFAGLTLKDLKKFRSIESPLTGHGESHLFPEGVLLSNGPLGSAFPQAQGLAFADKLAGRDRVTVTAITDGACMEGEAREALAAVPGFAAKGKLNPFVLILSDNNTKLTGRIDADSYSMAPTFSALKDLGWQVVDLLEAHDVQACVIALERAVMLARENPLRPVVVHARTVKGVGVKKTAESASGGHGFPLKAPGELRAFLSEIYGGDESAIPKVFLEWIVELEELAAAKKKSTSAGTASTAGAPEVKVQVGVAKALIRKRQEGLPVVSLTSDLPGSTGVADFIKAFPLGSQDVGVSESNMVSMAAGLSKLGYIPVVDTFAQFGVTKGALPLTMASLSQAPLIAIFSHVGFQDAADGASHQALCYFAMASAIPHVRVVALTSSDEAEALVGQAVDEFAALVKAGKTPDSTVFFLGRENFPLNYGVKDYQLGRAQVLREPAGASPASASPASAAGASAGGTASVVIAAAGACVGQALEAADMLAASGVSVAVVNPSVINRPDVATFARLLGSAAGRGSGGGKPPLLLTVEDHQWIAGMGSQLIHALTEAGLSFRARSLGVRGEFGQSAYNAIDLYRRHGLDAQAIHAAALK